MENHKLVSLREEMKRRGIHVYLIPTSDFHNSEYVGEHFKAREYLTGFTGSAGTAVVTEKQAGLWTDGRYFIQAEAELAGSGFELYRIGVEHVPTVREFIEKALPEGGVIGFDGRVVSAKDAEAYRRIAEKKHGSLHVTEDLVDLFWTNRPAMACTPLWILAKPYSGESAASKLARIRERMREEGADWHILASLCDIAWTLNLRAGDIAHCPVFLSFLLIGMDEATLFVQQAAVADEVRAYLTGVGVAIAEYDRVYDALTKLPEDVSPAGLSGGGTSARKTALLLDRGQANCRLVAALPESVRIIDKEDPSVRMKAVKNETELSNTRVAHLKDGIAMTKFMCWLKTNVGRIPMDEYTVGAYADELRERTEHFLDSSFESICACGPNAAMMHYAASKEGAAQIKPEGFLLLDSGGHYLEGTTDITRTFVLGPVTDTMRLHYTTVVRCMFTLAHAKFLAGCGGISLDALCREPLWERGIDYRCGTGHGVGHILNVHEGPNGFRYRVVPERSDAGVLEPGMITTDEPGVYLEGEYGIRVENELLCVADEKNEYGRFLRFEPLTLCPIDLDGIEPALLSERERRWLNDYHRMVYECIAPHLTEPEKIWLAEYTRAI